MFGQELVYRQSIATPFGKMVCCAGEEGLYLLQFEDSAHYPKQMAQIERAVSVCFHEESNQHIAQLQQELEEYFTGCRTVFSVPLQPLGTAFQQSVWASLQQIPFGQALSYRQQSEKMGNSLAIRAVAAANGKNPLAIVIPCHRVVGSKGALTGFAGGLWRKQKLLELEGAILF